LRAPLRSLSNWRYIKFTYSFIHSFMHSIITCLGTLGLSLASTRSGLGLGLQHAGLEPIPGLRNERIARN